MTKPAHLHLVDADTGEVLEDCPGCMVLKDEVAGLNRDLRGWRARYAQLKREKDVQAKEHPRWTELEGLFDLWRRVCRHPRSRFTPDDFWLALPFFEQHGQELCELAIHGAGFDPFTTTRKNGSAKRFDDWSLVFRDRSKFEDFCNRAPRSATG